MVEQMLYELEWVMQSATEQAMAQHAKSGLTVDPRLLRERAHLSTSRATVTQVELALDQVELQELSSTYVGVHV